MSCDGCTFKIDNSRPAMLDTYDWLNDLPDTTDISDMVEVRFKSTRKEYFKNTETLDLKRGDTVVVATSPGHDVGVITLTGYLAEKQFNLKIKNKERYVLQTIYRKANKGDLENWEKAKNLEKPTMIRARQIAASLNLNMKIGDVEYRGDSGKAIFYYIADGRVDFRELIKHYASEFRIRVEMKQIGARQEAGRVGGIGSCGRELCCSSWRTDFTSISTDSIIKQGLSPSASKMAGACGKLKCCLMYEIDAYMEAGEDFPKELLSLNTSKGLAKPIKTDYLAKKIWYTITTNARVQTFELSTTEVKDIIQQNKKGIKPDLFNEKVEVEGLADSNINEDSIDRFDKPLSKQKVFHKKNRNSNRNRNPHNKPVSRK
ncbi:MAG: hypothetical protein HQ541_21040 [Mariniphaga sp.]|nr:hypothetical protein [Mariniphaga sp.]